MASPQRRNPETRTFRGEREAAGFLDALKGLKGQPKVRVLEVLHLVQKVESLSAQIETGNGRLDYESPQMDELERLINVRGRLNALLARYRVRPMVYRYGVMQRGGSLLTRLPHSVHRGASKLLFSFASIDKRHKAEIAAVWTIMRLAEMQSANRIRRCSHCSNWFFARFEHQSHCAGGRCRIAEFQKTEKGKRYRREKSKEYYWLHKTKNVK